MNAKQESNVVRFEKTVLEYFTPQTVLRYGVEQLCRIVADAESEVEA